VNKAKQHLWVVKDDCGKVIYGAPSSEACYRYLDSGKVKDVRYNIEGAGKSHAYDVGGGMAFVPLFG
jgi:hypothetical protein